MNLITPHKPTKYYDDKKLSHPYTERNPLSQPFITEPKTNTTHNNHNYLCRSSLSPLEHHTRSHGMVGTQCAQVTNMRSMFNEASSFNGDLSKWDVSNVSGKRGRGRTGG